MLNCKVDIHMMGLVGQDVLIDIVYMHNQEHTALQTSKHQSTMLEEYGAALEKARPITLKSVIT